MTHQGSQVFAKYETIGEEDVEKNSQEEETTVYTKRWFVLLLFCLCSLTNGTQWIQFASISTTIADFYQVSQAQVNWLSLVYMVVYIPLIFPVTKMLDYCGLRTIILCGSFLNALAACIKIACGIYLKSSFL